MKLLVLFVVTLIFLQVHCFNIEIRNPIVKKGDPGSYFGYSVAQHKSINNSNSIQNSW